MSTIYTRKMFCLLLMALLELGCAQTDFNFELEVTNIAITSISIRYSVEPGEGVIGRANITAVYSDRCSDPVPTNTAILEGNSESYTISNLEEYSLYEITVILDLTNIRTGMMSMHVLTLGTVPASPANFRQTAATMTSITVVWDDIPCLDRNSEIELYSINYMLLPNGTIMTNSARSTATLYEIDGLSPGAVYTVTLGALYTVDNSMPLTDSITQPITGNTFSIPGPFNLRAMSTENSIQLSWSQEVPGSSVRQYNLSAVYGGPCTGLSDIISTTINARMNRRYRFRNLLSFGSYQLTVTAISRDMRTASSSITATTLASVPTGPPLSLHLVNAGAFSLTVAWSPLDCEDRRGEIIDYDLYYGPTRTYSSTNRVTIARIASTRQVFMGLIPETSYSVQVAANNIEGMGPLHEIINVVTTEPSPGVSDLRVNLNSVQATSAIVNWTRTPGTSYFLTVEYIGPCVGANVASQRRVVDDRIQGDYELTGLQPHSQYLVNVWPTESVTNASVLVLTATAIFEQVLKKRLTEDTVAFRFSRPVSSSNRKDPVIGDDYVTVRSINDTTITLDVPPLDCINQNTEISSLYSIRYGQLEELENNTNIITNSFSPGVVTIGSLFPGTNYSFEVTISTVDGRVRILRPVTGTTVGAPPISTSRPEPPSTPAPVPQVPVFVVIVVIVVVVCIILALTVILVICCISSFRRRHQRKKRQDQNELNRISRIARALKERDNQVAKHPPEAASSDHEVQQNRPFSFSSIGSRKSNPFNDMNWMSGMTESTTMADENIELFEQENPEVNTLNFDEKDFEYEKEGPKHAENFKYEEGGFEYEEGDFNFEGLEFQTDF